MNWKEEYINKFCTFEGENRMVFKNKITADESLNFIEQIISERDKERDKWKVLAEAMDNAPVGHRVIIKHLLGEDEWTLTRRNK